MNVKKFRGGENGGDLLKLVWEVNGREKTSRHLLGKRLYKLVE